MNKIALFMKLVKTTIKIMSTLFYPLNPLEYISGYFNICNDILLRRNWKLIFAVHLVNLTGVLKAAHLCYLALTPNLTQVDQAIHFDGIFILIPKQSHNLV